MGYPNPTRSPSAIGVFVFLASILIFIPALIFVLMFVQRRRRRSEQSTGESGNSQASIEMGNLQPPPPPTPSPAAVAVAPIRSMSVGRSRPLPALPSISGMYYTGFPNGPGPEIVAHTPIYSNAYSQSSHYTEPTPTTTNTNPFANPAPPASPRYNLQTALDCESSPVSVRVAGERKASINDAPRVQSQRATPVRRQDVLEESLYPPAVPGTSFDDGYFEHAHQQRWV